MRTMLRLLLIVTSIVCLTKNVEGFEQAAFINGNQVINGPGNAHASLCQGDVAWLRINYFGGGLDTITWSNGVRADSIAVTSAGTYIATTTSIWGTEIDTFVITFPFVAPVANAGLSQTLPGCGTDTLGGRPTASGGTPPYSYSWSPDSGMAQSYYATTSNPVVYGVSNPYNYLGLTTPITYKLIVTDSLGCTATGSVTITPLLTTPITPPVATLTGCELSCQIVPNFSYQWYHIKYGPNAIVAVSGATSPTYSEDSTDTWYAVITSTIYPQCHILSNYLYVTAYQNQPICIVTLDSTNTYNLVVWDKTPGLGINKGNNILTHTTRVFSVIA